MPPFTFTFTGVVRNATAARDAHLSAVTADTTCVPAQLNVCNEASALWAPKGRASVRPVDRDYLCTYQS